MLNPQTLDLGRKAGLLLSWGRQVLRVWIKQGTHSPKGLTYLSDSRSDRPAGAVLYSEKLLGLRSECPACGEWERSTGWLLSREGDPSRWYVDLKCTGCLSHGGTWKREWLPLIEELIEAEREPFMAAPSNPCTQCEGDGECNACSGTGVDIGVAMLAGHEGDCERCGGTGACAACGGSGKVR